MMAVFDALDGQRQELILICSQFLLEEQQEDERDRLTAPVRVDLLLVGHLDGISTTGREVVKLGAVGTPGVARLKNSGAVNSSDAASKASAGGVALKCDRLPGPVADLWEWQSDGSCRSGSPDVFFHPEGERGPSRRRRDRAAKAVCLECAVLRNCREHALQVREPYGVWGGLTEYEREAIHLASTDSLTTN
jgi:WhiB family transcriptional regulator, redox-sensing transcriptional regulator